MTDETKLHLDLSRAARARQITDNELFREAFQKLEADYIKELMGSAAHEQRKRENLWQAVQILGNLRDHFSTILMNGKIAKAELDQLSNMKRPKAA